MFFTRKENMNKTFFSLLLLSVLGFVGYKYYYQNQSFGCHSCSEHRSPNSEVATEDHNNSVVSLMAIEDLDRLLSNEKPSFVKVYLDGCPPCKQAALVYPDIANQFPNVAFYDLNVANSVVMNALIEKNVIERPITAAPTFLFIKNGKVVEIMQGFNSKENLIDQINSLLNS